MNVSPKSIVVSAIESNEEMKRFIDTFSGAMSSNGRILLSILPAISSVLFLHCIIFLGKILYFYKPVKKESWDFFTSLINALYFGAFEHNFPGEHVLIGIYIFLGISTLLDYFQ